MYRLVAVILFSYSFAVNAEWVSTTGEIAKIKSFSQNSMADGGAVAGATWVKLNGVNNLGACPIVGSHGLIIYIPRNNNQLSSLVLAARMAGKNIEIGLDDSKRFHNGCVADSISLI